MKVQHSETKVVNKELPDHFGYDDSKLGRVVDILVGAKRREDLYSDEKRLVEGAAYDLEDAYGKAIKILGVFCDVETAAPTQVGAA